jgi:hypothetical protein
MRRKLVHLRRENRAGFSCSLVKFPPTPTRESGPSAAFSRAEAAFRAVLPSRP